MNRFLLAGSLVLSLAVASWADVDIQEVLARRKGASVNIRVTVVNPAGKTQAGPVVVDLFVRGSAADKWQKITSWNNIQKLAAKNRVSRDYFDENNATLKALAEAGAFEIRATATAPGAPKVGEKTASWKDTDSGK